jgi:protease-4
MSFLGGLLLVGLAVAGLAGENTGEIWGGFGDKVGVITIAGVITSADQEGTFGGVTPGARSIMAQIRAAAKDDSVKAVVLRVDSPGGGASASQEIHGEVVKLADEKPVVVSMGGVAASGGYYVSAAADEIYANPATLTGSIGVIMSTVQYQDMLGKIGVEMGALTTGPYKDTGSPVRPMRDDEREMMQAIADGRVLTGEQALDAGLVDKLGNYHDAIAAAAELGGIEGEPKIKRFSSSGGLRGILGSMMARQRQHAIDSLLQDFRLSGVEWMLRMQPLAPE